MNSIYTRLTHAEKLEIISLEELIENKLSLEDREYLNELSSPQEKSDFIKLKLNLDIPVRLSKNLQVLNVINNDICLTSDQRQLINEVELKVKLLGDDEKRSINALNTKPDLKAELLSKLLNTTVSPIIASHVFIGYN